MTGEREGLRHMYGDDLDDPAPEEQSLRAEVPHHVSTEEQLDRAVIPAPDGYSQYWITISFMLRNSASWQCDACCVQLRDQPRLLASG